MNSISLPVKPKMQDDLKWAQLSDAMQDLREQFGASSIASRLSDEQIEIIYGFAYDLHLQGKFEMAIQQLKLILLYRPFHHRALLALGINLKRLGQFADAIPVFTASIVYSEGNPQAAIHIAECLSALGEMESSKQVLEPLIKIASMDEAYASLLRRAQALHQMITAND